MKLENNIWSDEELQLLCVFLEHGYTYSTIANELNRSIGSIRGKIERSNLNSKNNQLKTHDTYVTEVPKDINVLGNYINNSTKILHKHICGYEWYVKPTAILQGHSCPRCKTVDYSADTYTYLIYLQELDVYKVGTTKNINARFRRLCTDVEILLIHKFSNMYLARELENKWLSTLIPYFVDTKELPSGNKETFYYE